MRFFNVPIRKEHIPLSTVQPDSPMRAGREGHDADGWIGRAGGQIATRKIAVGGEHAVRSVRISFNADGVAQVPIIKLVEICRRPAPQIRRAREQSGRAERTGQREEMFK